MGNGFKQDDIIVEMHQVKPKIVAMVHGETSTGRLQPLEKIGEACRALDALLL